MDARADETARKSDDPGRMLRVPRDMFEAVEHVVYLALAVLLSLTGVLVLCGAGLAFVGALRDWSSVHPALAVVERLLFALMLIEILHTVRASIRSGTLTPEPFLVVGLIASIRRMLVITLESSQQTQAGNWSSQSESLFRAAMTELGVLAVLILVLVVSIYLLRRRHAA
jgi:uncharacterized membrane protein (DUF373 family)